MKYLKLSPSGYAIYMQNDTEVFLLCKEKNMDKFWVQCVENIKRKPKFTSFKKNHDWGNNKNLFLKFYIQVQRAKRVALLLQEPRKIHS